MFNSQLCLLCSYEVKTTCLKIKKKNVLSNIRRTAGSGSVAVAVTMGLNTSIVSDISAG